MLRLSIRQALGDGSQHFTESLSRRGQVALGRAGDSDRLSFRRVGEGAIDQASSRDVTEQFGDDGDMTAGFQFGQIEFELSHSTTIRGRLFTGAKIRSMIR